MADYTIKMTYEKAAQARALYKAGSSVKDLCKKFSLSERAMYDIVQGKSWIRKDNAKKNQRKEKNIHPSPSSEDKWEAVYALWMEGKEPREITDELGLSPGYVGLILWAVRSARKDPSWSCNNQKLTKWAFAKTTAEAIIPVPSDSTRTEEPPEENAMPTLLPCPFCGSSADIWIIRVFPSDLEDYSFLSAHVECDICGARTRSFKYCGDEESVDFDDNGVRRAVVLWNWRRGT